MLDIKFIRENPELVKTNSKNRLSNVDIDKLLELDKQKREIETQMGNLQAQRNKLSKSKPSQEDIQKVKEINDTLKEMKPQFDELIEQHKQIRLQVPNLTHPKVVVSDDEDNNPVLEQVGKIPEFDFQPKDHVELSEINDLIDFHRATKVSGSKFYFLKNDLVVLEQALIKYAFDIVQKNGFNIFSTPDLAKTDVLEKIGFQPRGESTQVYNIENSDLSLIGTAEITMCGYHMDEVILQEELPKRYAALSHCYRTESGSYGKYAKGIFRVHQFSKVEMFGYCIPNDAEKIHNEMLSIEKEIFSGLGIPFRVIDHCTADLGGPSIRTYDLEAWMPGKPNKDGTLGDWGEITSTSNCTDFQSRGLNIKYQKPDGTKEYVYTLNGTAISLARALIALIENYQQKDGKIKIPQVLQNFMGKEYIG